MSATEAPPEVAGDGCEPDGYWVCNPSLLDSDPDGAITFRAFAPPGPPRTDYGRPRHRDEVLSMNWDTYMEAARNEGLQARASVAKGAAIASPAVTPAPLPPGYRPLPVPHTPLRIIRPAEFEGMPLPPREWIVPDWLGSGYVTLLYADGGLGKSSLGQSLLASCATGTPFLGMDVTRCRALGLFCEDEPDELQRRQAAINAAAGVSFSDLDGVAWMSGVGQDNILVTFSRDGVCSPTARFRELREQAMDLGARLVLVDTAADTFGGNENDRAQVRQYIGHVLTGLAQDIRGAVLVNAHPSRSGLAIGGDQSSGSTGWNNAARSRWSLEAMREGADDYDADVRILTRRKANYSKRGETLKLRWQNGVLGLPAAPTLGATFAAISRENEAEERFMILLAKFDAEGRPLSVSNNAPNYAPRLFAARDEARGFNKGALKAAMERLFGAGRIANVEYGRAGDQRRKIAAAVVN